MDLVTLAHRDSIVLLLPCLLPSCADHARSARASQHAQLLKHHGQRLLRACEHVHRTRPSVAARATDGIILGCRVPPCATCTTGAIVDFLHS